MNTDIHMYSTNIISYTYYMNHTIYNTIYIPGCPTSCPREATISENNSSLLIPPVYHSIYILYTYTLY